MLFLSITAPNTNKTDNNSAGRNTEEHLITWLHSFKRCFVSFRSYLRGGRAFRSRGAGLGQFISRHRLPLAAI